MRISTTGIYAIAFALAMTGIKANAQVPSNTRDSAHAVAMPAAYVLPTVNAVRTWSPSKKMTLGEDVLTASIKDVKQNTTYFDGLGRPLQTVATASSPSGHDVVAPFLYDKNGREQYKYLPYVDLTHNDGALKASPFADQAAFYQNSAKNPGVQGEQVFYSEMQYEVSPLNRVLKSFGPGNSWASTGGNRPVQHQYLTNLSSDSVRVWFTQPSDTRPVSTSMYAVGQLVKEVSIDEQGHTVVSFKNDVGQLILSKVSLTSTGSGYTGWLSTYYVYDIWGNLSFVIPPKAVELIKITWSIPSDVADELCFRYTYDNLGRVIAKKMPGKALEEMVYDVRDRMVLYRSANLKGKWLLTYYDGLNRPIQTSLYADTSSQVSLQNTLTSSGALNPVLTPALITPQTYTYYDDYSYGGAKACVTAELSKPGAGSNPNSEPASSPSNLTQGLVTGSKVLVAGTTQWLVTSSYYDSKSRLIQTVSDNIQGGTTVNTTLYDFSGNILATYLHLTNPHSVVTPDIKVLTAMTYDTLNRLVSVTDTVNDAAINGRTIVKNTYDELGRIAKITIGGNKDNSSYIYNINGWLSSINKDYLTSSNSEVNHFAESLSYDNGFSVRQFNGNIAGEIWKGFSDGVPRAYGFTYDNADRILKAMFNQQNTGSTLWTADKVDFSSTVTGYDANGNIDSLKQNGLKGAQIAAVDQLRYKYLANSNKLSYVTDGVRDPASTLGDFRESAQNVTANQSDTADYAYDANGDLIKDANKGISAISYNYLNLPDYIQINGKGRIGYLYDAVGNKLRKTVIDSTVTPVKTTVTDYLSGIVYQNDTLQFIPHPQGRVRAVLATGQPVKYVYDYFVKDHLGNIREVLTEKSDTAVYAATMETAMSAKENALFSNIDATRAAVPSGYPSDNLTNPDAYVAALNAATGKKVGPSLVLRIMAGDTIQAAVSAFYKSTDVVNRNNYGTQMVSALLQAFSAGATADGPHTGSGSSSPIAISLDTTMYNNLVKSDPSWATKPKSYLNYVFFDDQFNLQNVSGVKQVPATANVLLQLASGQIVVPKTGFAYIYVSNESGQEVDFNNLVVTHKSGPLLEETHYYPFGLTMAGISSHALGKQENRFKYNGIELDTSLGINACEANYRDLDPQIGRWCQIDPKIEEGMEIWSPYGSNYDNPIRYSDFAGDAPGDGLLGTVWTATVNTFNFTRQAVNGALVGTTDNLLGTNLRADYGARYIHDQASARGWNTGLNVADAAGLVAGAGESAGGVVGTGAGAIVTVGSAGGVSAVSVPATVVGIGMFAHGILVMKNSAANLVNQTGRVHINETSNASGTPEPQSPQKADGAQNAPKRGNKPNATGTPNSSTIDQRDAQGRTTRYTTYDRNGNIIFQVEKDRGVPRHGVSGATKKIPTFNTLPDGTVRQGKYNILPAAPGEVPPGQ